MRWKQCLGLMLVVVVCAVSTVLAAGPDARAQHVITISVDGGGSAYVQALMEAGKLPNMQKLHNEGASTFNARTDYDYTITLPNHICMVTGRGVMGPEGHNWAMNTDPKPGQTLHTNRGSHVFMAFEVAHDAGLRTGLWSTKTKFSLFYESCKVADEAQSQVNKMDAFCRKDTAELITADFLEVMRTRPVNYAFVHFGDTDAAGHAQGWGSPAYNAAMIRIDGCIGQILNVVQSTEGLGGTTAIILTADHGGIDKGHGNPTREIEYTIPFFVWGAGVERGDLYAMNPTRQNPGTGRPTYAEEKQPVRNGDAGNLGLRLLGLQAIPGSTIGNKLDLQTQKPALPPALPLPLPATQPSKQAA